MIAASPMRARAVAMALAVVTATALLIAPGALVAPQSAVADTAPPSGVLATASTDILPTPQIDASERKGVVWTQVVVGGLVFVGGSFTTARPAGAAVGVSTVKRTNLMAYNVKTGVMTAFAPTLNGQVRGLAASPDGKRLYAVGEFTTVNGLQRKRIAAFDVATGNLLASFAPQANARVNAVVATSSAVYVGGWFSLIGTARRYGAASFSTSDGRLLPFAPKPEGGSITSMVMAPDGSKLVLGGSFTTLNGSGNPGYGMGAVNPSTGGSLPWAVNATVRDAGSSSGITSLSSDGDSVYGTGYLYKGAGNLEGAFRARWSDGKLMWVEDCHGDSYSIAPAGDVVYVASHAHYCGNVGGFPEQDLPNSSLPMTQRSMAFTKAAGYTITADPLGYANWAGKPAPQILNWWPDINTGTASGQGQGAWSVVTSGDYVMLAGEFTAINNKPQQGLVRFAKTSIAPNLDGPRSKGDNYVPAVESIASGVVKVTWPANYDRDNSKLTYQLIRDGETGFPVYTTTAESRVWFDRPDLTYLDTGLTPGQTYTYRVRTLDPFGNSVSGSDATIRATATGSLSSYRKRVLVDSPSSYWRLGETSGTVAADSGLDLNAIANSTVGFGNIGAIVGDSDRAAYFNGTNSLVATHVGIHAPQKLTVETWFKSTSTAGGQIVGFGNRSSGNSTVYDRDIHLDPSGRVSFGTYSTGDRRVISGPGYNDGQWHHVAATLSPSGMNLYVDGSQVSYRTDVKSGRFFVGYWRIGGDASRLGIGYFKGTIDEVAVYDRALTSAHVATHYNRGRGVAQATEVDPSTDASVPDFGGTDQSRPDVPTLMAPESTDPGATAKDDQLNGVEAPDMQLDE